MNAGVYTPKGHARHLIRLGILVSLYNSILLI